MLIRDVGGGKEKEGRNSCGVYCGVHTCRDVVGLQVPGLGPGTCAVVHVHVLYMMY